MGTFNGFRLLQPYKKHKHAGRPSWKLVWANQYQTALECNCGLSIRVLTIWFKAYNFMKGKRW